MLHFVYEISKNSGTISISVNGIKDNIEEIFGVIFNYVTSDQTIYIKLLSLYEKEDLAGETLVI
jgi:hypothetical protein